MTEAMRRLARSIVNHCLKVVSSLKIDDCIEAAEITRLACLNWVINNYLKTDELILQRPSFFAQQHYVDQSFILKTAQEVLSSLKINEIDEQLQNMIRIEVSILLGMIHSICLHLIKTPQGLSLRDHGVFYTPLYISEYISERTIGDFIDAGLSKPDMADKAEYILSMRLLDPACGSGIFLFSAFHSLSKRLLGASNSNRSELPDNTTARLLDSLYGVDIDEAAVEISALGLSIIASDEPLKAMTRLIGRSLKVGDSLISPRSVHDARTQGIEIPKWVRPFDWNDEFHDVFSSNPTGFDFVIMNPPYQRLKPNLAEYLRDRLLIGEREVNLEDYEQYRRNILGLNHLFRSSDEYRVSNRRTIDLYRLFVERALRLTHGQSRIGFIIPSTILGDLSAAQLRQELLLNNRIELIDEFRETGLFQRVSQSTLIMIVQRGQPTELLRARFGLRSQVDLHSAPPIVIPFTEMRAFLRGYFVIPRSDSIGWSILKQMHKFPSIDENPNIQVFRGELDLTLDKEYITTKTTAWKLVRGRNISRYELRGLDDTTEYVNFHKLMKNRSLGIRKGHRDLERLACQQISNMSQRWRLKFSLVPPMHILANSSNYLVYNGPSRKMNLLYLLGLLNSELLNWRFKTTNSNNHIAIHELSSLPIVPFNPESSDALDLVNEVRQTMKGRNHAEIAFSTTESIVFRIYNIKPKQAKHVLAAQGLSSEDASQIINLI